MTADKRTRTVVRVGGLALAVAVVLAGVLAPFPNVSWEAQAASGIFVATIVLWLTEPVPYAVASVASVTLLFLFGLTDSFDAAVSGFASRLVFFLLLLFIIGGTLSTVGLDERFASRLLDASSTPRGTVRSLAVNLFGLSIVMPSAIARTVAFLPLVERLGDAYELDADSEFRHASAVVLGHLNPVASLALMTGGGMPVITSELLADTVREVTWVEWLVLMFPPIVVLYALSVLVVLRLSPVEPGSAAETSSLTADGGGPLDRDQRIVVGVITAMMIAWVGGSFVGLPTIVPVAAAVTVLALPGVGIVTAADFRDLSWGILFLIGAMFSQLNVLRSTGALDLFVDGVLGLIPLATFSLPAVVLALLLVTAALRLPFSTAPAAIIVIFPVIVEVGGALDVNRLYLGLSVLIVIASTSFLPFNVTTVLLQMERTPLNFRSVFRFALVTFGTSLFVLAACWAVYWPLVT